MNTTADVAAPAVMLYAVAAAVLRRHLETVLFTSLP